MAPLPENNTGVVFHDYSANGAAHTVQFRYAGSGLPTGSFLNATIAALNALSGLMPSDWTYLGSRFRAKGSLITFNQPITPTPVLTGTVTGNAGEKPAFASVVGRTIGGRRCRVYVIGAAISPADDSAIYQDYRITEPEASVVSNYLTALEGITDLVGIDEQPVIWNRYINLGYHAYWQRKARG